MATLTTTSGQEFTPPGTSFRVKSTGASSILSSKSDAGDPNWGVTGIIDSGRDYAVDNSVAGTIYKIDAGPGATIRAWG